MKDTNGSGPLMATKRDIASILGKSSRTVDTLAVDGLPRTMVGTRFMYPVAECVAWMNDRRTYRPPAEAGDAEERWRQARARKWELEADALEGKLVPMADVAAETGEMVARLRGRLSSVPSKYAHQLAPLTKVTETRRALEDMVDEVVAELRLTGEALGDEDGDNDATA